MLTHGTIHAITHPTTHPPRKGTHARAKELTHAHTGGIFCGQQVSWQVELFSASGGDALCLSKVRLLGIVAALRPRRHPRLSEAANFFAHNCQFWLWAKMIRGRDPLTVRILFKIAPVCKLLPNGSYLKIKALCRRSLDCGAMRRGVPNSGSPCTQLLAVGHLSCPCLACPQPGPWMPPCPYFKDHSPLWWIIS